MRIALFTDTYLPEINGVAVSVDNHIKVLRQHGHDVYLVTTSPLSKITEENDVLRIPGIEFKKIYGYRMSSFFNARAYVLVQRWKPDLVHIHTDASVGIFGKIMSNLLNIPSVVTYHTMYEDYTHYAGVLEGVAKRLVKNVSRSIAEQCTEFIAPSKKTKDKIRSYGADRYINVVPTGIDFSLFLRDDLNQKKISEIRAHYHLGDAKVMLSLGRIAKEKSVDMLIDNFSYYVNQCPHDKIKFLIVGDGPDRQGLIDKVSHLHLTDKIHFVGAVPFAEVPYYYALADIFVSASLTETQGLTFMEAMMSDCVILCRYDDNLAQLIQHQETGFIFNDKQDFSSLLHQLITMPLPLKDKILRQSKQALQPYTLANFYHNIIEVYHRALRQYW
jgi:1,2-diacylglycerol 3-alpha-glucosyltransferase